MPYPTDTPAADTARAPLAVLGPRELAVRAALEETVLSWAAGAGAEARQYPPLLPTAELARFDYWTNFPHLALLATGAREECADELTHTDHTAIAPALLGPASYALPSAACYAAYLDLAGRRLDAPVKITTVATCFRRETRYEGLRRLLGFSMREVICVGDRDSVLAHIASFKERISAFAGRLGLPLAVRPATDPFFEQDSARTLMQRLFPVKEEFVHGDTLAIASVNFHRNFFGERCGIHLADGSPAFTSCVAFGLERWLAALSERFGADCPDLPDRIRTAAAC
ncbi:aminoacyl--tRNA ligase-related protein [Streptomyces sp. BBFR2]|uniref:aminoacyl--tRNA ligase-related protein n=1 Tax=Streptomyces sp. BBFR2 TaxID=3372854 RepID=UPI0037D9FCF7